jgi:hypothetical protein
VSGADPVIAELEAKYGPAPTWRRFRPERDADRELRARIEEARERRERGEAPYGDDLPF